MLNLRLDAWQKKFLETQGDKILCTGRQVGKSLVCSIDAGEYAVNNSNKTILMIAPTERQAYELFEKTLNYLSQHHSRKIKKKKAETNKSKISLNNGTIIRCLPTGLAGIGIRGFTIDRLYVDEASRVPEPVWAAITPMLLTTGGALILISTPYGARGRFWETWTNKDNAFVSFKKFSINSEECIRQRKISPTWTEKQREYALRLIEQEKKRMSRREYAQEYLGEFMDDLSRFYSDELIRKCCALQREQIISKKGEYYLGVDIARMGEDKSAFQILKKINKDNIVQVESLVTRKQLTTDTEHKILMLDQQYNFQKIFIDAGAGTLGVSILDHLLENSQTRTKVVAINNRAISTERDGSRKQRLLKEDLYSNLLMLMQQNKIKLLDDEGLIESLRSVQYEYVTQEDRPTKIRIFSTPHNLSDIVEALIRAAWCSKYKSLNIWISSIKL